MIEKLGEGLQVLLVSKEQRVHLTKERLEGICEEGETISVLQDVEDGEELFTSSNCELMRFEEIADAQRDQDVAHTFHCQVEIGLELALFDLVRSKDVSWQFWNFDFHNFLLLLVDF